MTEQNETQPGGAGGRVAESDRFSDHEQEASLRELALVPWKRKAVVAGCTLCCLLLAVLASVMMHPKYRATATIELNEDKGGGANLLSNLSSMASGDPDEPEESRSKPKCR